MKTIGSTELQKRYPQLLNELEVHGNPLKITRHGRVVGALISSQDLVLLELVKNEIVRQAAGLRQATPPSHGDGGDNVSALGPTGLLAALHRVVQ